MVAITLIIVLAYCHLRRDFPTLEDKYILCDDIVRLINARYSFPKDKQCTVSDFNKALGKEARDTIGSNDLRENTRGLYRLWRTLDRRKATIYYYAGKEGGPIAAPPRTTMDWKQVLEESAAAVDLFMPAVETLPMSPDDNVNADLLSYFNVSASKSTVSSKSAAVESSETEAPLESTVAVADCILIDGAPPNPAVTLPQRKCTGIPHAKLQAAKLKAGDIPAAELAKLMGTYDYIQKRWYARGCEASMFVPGNDKESSCSKCATKVFSIRKKEYPGLYGECQEAVGEIVSHKALRIAIEACIGKHQSLEAFLDDEEAHRFAAVLFGGKIASVQVTTDAGEHFFSNCARCNTPVLVDIHKRVRNFECGNCPRERYYDCRNRKRRVQNYDPTTQCASNSRTTFTNLLLFSPEKKRARLRLENVARELQRHKKLSANLWKRLEDIKNGSECITTKLSDDSDEGVRKPTAVEGVVEALLKQIDMANSEEMKDAHKAMVLQILNGGREPEDQISDFQVEHFISQIQEIIQNYGKTLRNKSKTIRYSPYILRMAMSIWTRSPSAYREMRSNGWIVPLPSESRLHKLRGLHRVTEGECELLYHWWAAHNENQGETKLGLLMCDEMKLVENTAWNTKTHEVTGFIVDFRDMDDIIRQAFTHTPKEEPAVEVNLWKFQSTSNECIDCEFFFNAGNLSNATLRKQFLHVLANLALINCEVIGFKTDGNSLNTTAMMLLSEAGVKPLQDSFWLDRKYVSFKNPMDPDKIIFLFLCSTHQQKSMRNQLKTSTDTGKRNFIDEFGYPYGWKGLVQQLRRDQRRSTPQTDLNEPSIYPDGFDAMNVCLSKKPFNAKTIAEGIAHVCDLAKINVPGGQEDDYEDNENCFRPVTHIQSRGPLLGIYSARLEQVKKAVHDKKEELKSINVFETVMSQLALLGYQVIIHDIFHEVLMNKELELNAGNIDAFKLYIQKKMDYFRRWRKSAVARKDAGKGINTMGLASFLSPPTWYNLRMSVCGFFEYAEYAVKTRNVAYVAMLYSNTSTIETTFSQIRDMGGADSQRFTSVLGSRSTRNSIASARRMSSWDPNLCLKEVDRKNENDQWFNTSYLATNKKQVETKKQNYQNLFIARREAATTKAMLLPRRDCWPEDIKEDIKGADALQNGILSSLEQQQLGGHFSCTLVLDTFLLNHYILAQHSGRNEKFDALATMSDHDESSFDDACQSALVSLLPTVCKSVLNAAQIATDMESAAIKDADKMVKWHFDDEEAAKKWREAGYDEKDRKAKKLPSKTGVRKSNANVFQTACFDFIQSGKIDIFQKKLPKQFQGDRLFAILLLEALWKVFTMRVKVCVAEQPNEILPQVPMLESSSVAGQSFSKEVDEGSEIHRFVGSGITTLRNTIIDSLRLKKRKDRLEASKKIRRVGTKAKAQRRKQLALDEAKINLLTKMRILRKDLPEVRDKSYDSGYLEALNRGGLSYVNPIFLEWARSVMKLTRNCISQHSIKESGMAAQQEAYRRVREDQDNHLLFSKAVEQLPDKYEEGVIRYARTAVMAYAFHARSEVEWKKYRAVTTDRHAGRGKKLNLRENLKPRGS